MPQESGLAAVIEGGQGNLGFDPSRMMEMILRLKEAKRQSATQDLQTALEITQKVPGAIEASDLEKKFKEWAKATGFKPGDAGTMKAAKQQQVSSGQGASIQAVGKAGIQSSGAQSATPVTPQAAAKAPAGGIEPQMQGGGVFENYINQIRRTQQLSNLSAEKKAQAEIATDQLKADALNPDPAISGPAIQRGQSAGIFAFDKNLDLISKLDPTQKGQYYQSQLDQARGLESPKDKLDREERLTTSFVAAGWSPSDAAKLVKDPNDPSVKKSFKQLSEEAKAYSDLQEAFGDEPARKIAVQLPYASLSEILPNVGKTQSHFAQQMAETERQHKEQLEVEKSKVSAERERIGVEKEKLALEKELGTGRLELLQQRMELELSRAENAAMNKDVTSFVESMRIKEVAARMPAEVIDNIIEKLAGMKSMGMTKVEVAGTLNRLTFGAIATTESKYVSDITGGKAVVDKVLEQPLSSSDQKTYPPYTPPSGGGAQMIRGKDVTPEEVEEFRRSMEQFNK